MKEKPKALALMPPTTLDEEYLTGFHSYFDLNVNFTYLIDRLA
jgi:hypothetical protein